MKTPARLLLFLALPLLAVALRAASGPATAESSFRSDMAARASASTAIETDWSSPTKGVQLRISVPKSTWLAGEVPALKWSATNSGPRQFLLLTIGQRRAQLEVDGVWYGWSPGLIGANRLSVLPPGQTIQDQLVTLGPVWSRAKEEDLLWRRDHTGRFDSSQRDIPLLPGPGKHTIRLAVIVEPSRAGTGDGFRVVSLPLEILIETPSAGQSVNWQPNAELVDSVKRSISAATVALQSMPRPNDPNLPGWIESAVKQATETATLAAGTPLHDSMKELLDVLIGLRKFPAADPAGAREQLTAASKTLQQLVGVLSGETSVTPPATQPDASR